MSIYKLSVLVFFLGFSICRAQDGNKRERQQALIDEYLENCGNRLNYHMPEWQECLDNMLEKDSTVAYFWQQKAMPYFKERKYEVGMEYLDIAVKYDKEQLPYRAFIKCIFSKQYKDAIIDFEKSLQLFGNSYEMDHSYKFYIALCYIQLNEFKKAEHILAEELKNTITPKAEDNAHHVVLFYYGISKYEQKKWEEAITVFDRALNIYPQFSDVKCYKAMCLSRLGRNEESAVLYNEAAADFKKGYTINEDNAVYELYPYQITRYRE